MTTIEDFIQARLQDDEEAALAASPWPWSANAEHDEVVAVDGITVCDGFALSGRQQRATVDHIVRQDPARVLRQVAALRAVVELHHGGSWCDICPDPEDRHTRSPMPGEHLRHLAAIWADHPDYRPEWSA